MAEWLHGTKENFPLKHRHDRERKETADREHRREATHVSFSRAGSIRIPLEQTFSIDENRPSHSSSFYIE